MSESADMSHLVDDTVTPEVRAQLRSLVADELLPLFGVRDDLSIDRCVNALILFAQGERVRSDFERSLAAVMREYQPPVLGLPQYISHDAVGCAHDPTPEELEAWAAKHRRDEQGDNT